MLSTFSRSLRFKMTPVVDYLRLNNFAFRSFGAKVNYSGSDREVDKTKKPATLRPSGNNSDADRNAATNQSKSVNQTTATQKPTNAQQANNQQETNKTGQKLDAHNSPVTNAGNTGDANIKNTDKGQSQSQGQSNISSNQNSSGGSSNKSSTTPKKEESKVQVIETVVGHHVR